MGHVRSDLCCQSLLTSVSKFAGKQADLPGERPVTQQECWQPQTWLGWTLVCYQTCFLRKGKLDYSPAGCMPCLLPKLVSKSDGHLQKQLGLLQSRQSPQLRSTDRSQSLTVKLLVPQRQQSWQQVWRLQKRGRLEQLQRLHWMQGCWQS